MNSPSSVAQSGIGAAMLRLSAAANNIANLQTPGYRRELVQQEALTGGGVTSSIGQSAEPGDDLPEDIVQQRVASYSFKANLRVIQTQDDMLGSLLDLHA
jgi:flagellar hook-associated protein FlgK